VSEQKLHDELRPSDEEINALLAEPYTFSFQSVRASLNKRSTLFKYTWITLMAITTLYLMGWFTGLIKPFMAAGASGLEADYQLHQIRFLLAFIMFAVGAVALNYDYCVRETLIVSAWVQFYFLVTGIARYARTMPDDSYHLLAAYAGNLVFILFLVLILIVEEHRLQQRP
jgi:hypothetical protein